MHPPRRAAPLDRTPCRPDRRAVEAAMREGTGPSAADRRPPAGNPEAPLARRSPYARWRAAALFGVYLAIAAHVIHWRLSGR